RVDPLDAASPPNGQACRQTRREHRREAGVEVVACAGVERQRLVRHEGLLDERAERRVVRANDPLRRSKWELRVVVETVLLELHLSPATVEAEQRDQMAVLEPVDRALDLGADPLRDARLTPRASERAWVAAASASGSVGERSTVPGIAVHA